MQLVIHGGRTGQNLCKSFISVKKHPDYIGVLFLIFTLRMIMKIVFPFVALVIFIFSCTQQDGSSKAITKKVNRPWLDSIIKNSDSSYIKPYKRTDFVTAAFFVNKKDSTVCQVMKDSADSIRQIIMAKNDIRTFFAQYYTNGQLQAELPLDKFGQNHGPTTFFYKDGRVQNTGDYQHGLKIGQWKIFDKKGKLLSIDRYDKNGQVTQK